MSDIKKHEGLEASQQESVSNEHEARLEKVAAMQQAHMLVWPEAQEVNATCSDVVNEYKEGEESRLYNVAGRLMASREHGKTTFANIQDRTGRLQVYIKLDVVGEQAFATFKQFVDIGDTLWVSGHSFKTKTGEITLKVTDVKLLSKCLYPLPEKFHGLTDIETIYRQRYLDLISSPESRERFFKRSLIIRTMRSFFDAHGFIEVETPMLHPIPGGATARPFVTHHNALDIDLYMRIAPELYLKRLVVGGFERVYEINRNFRNEGISTRHNPEFTMVEFYMAHENYIFIMGFVETMLRTIATQACGQLQVPYGEHTLDFAAPFVRLSMHDAVMKYGNFTAQELLPETIDKALGKAGIGSLGANAGWGNKLAVLFEEVAEKQLIQPTFITDFPIEISPLAKRDAKNPAIAARFELYVAGMEISNGFNELNDPFDQAERFKAQVAERADGNAEAHHYDAEYITALEYGLPPTVGVGIGIDRLTMLLTNTTSIKDVILFPTLKPKE